ncbi:hypothetical protein HK096_000572, partial [Nowakowskiella sp. JEL0078]
MDESSHSVFIDTSPSQSTLRRVRSERNPSKPAHSQVDHDLLDYYPLKIEPISAADDTAHATPESMASFDLSRRLHRPIRRETLLSADSTPDKITNRFLGKYELDIEKGSLAETEFSELTLKNERDLQN